MAHRNDDLYPERADEVPWRESEMFKVAELAIEQLKADKDAFVGFSANPNIKTGFAHRDYKATNTALITTCDADGPFILLRPCFEAGYEGLEIVVRANGYRHARLVDNSNQLELRAKWMLSDGKCVSVAQATRDVWDLLESST